MEEIKVVSDEEIRIDNYLVNECKLSRSKIQKLIKAGLVLVNNKIVKNNYLVKNSDNIVINPDIFEKNELEAENIKLDIVYEDDDVIVVNKKSGMVVHPGAGNFNHTLVNALLYHTTNLSNEKTSRPGIVHRIDADTSGLLLVAKNDFAHQYLSAALKEKMVVRKYIALASGIINEDTATIDAPIGRDIKNRKRMMVTSQNSKHAVTHIKVLERYKKATLISCRLETGRTHQIRAHMKYIGHALINDSVYGDVIVDKEYGQMLHAEIIGFVHPRTNEYMEFKAELPKRFKEIINMFKD